MVEYRTEKEWVEEYRKTFDVVGQDLVWKISTSQKIKVGSFAGYREYGGKHLVQLHGRRIAVPRVIYAIIHGEIPEYLIHLDNNTQNNHPNNLFDWKKGKKKNDR